MASFGNDEHGYGKIFQGLHDALYEYQGGQRRSFAPDLLIDAMSITGRPATTPFAYMLNESSTHLWHADDSNFGPNSADPVYVANLYLTQRQAYFFWDGTALETVSTAERLQALLAHAEAAWHAEADSRASEAYLERDRQQYGSARGYSDVEE